MGTLLKCGLLLFLVGPACRAAHPHKSTTTTNESERQSPTSTAIAAATGHREDILRSQTCGCFHCLEVFAPGQISEWVDIVDGIGNTALCPRCGLDSVLGDASGFPITPTFLRAMHQQWFDDE